MKTYEYRVIPAPRRGIKERGLKSSEDRFAHALQTTINTQANDGWEYLRTDTLPSEERQGLTGRSTVYHNMLVFRRSVATAQTAEAPVAAQPMAASAAVPAAPARSQGGLTATRDERPAAPAGPGLSTREAQEIPDRPAPAATRDDPAKSGSS